MIGNVATQLPGMSGIVQIPLTIALTGLLLFLNREIFKRIQKRQKSIHVSFLKGAIQFAIVVVGVLFVFFGYQGIGNVSKMIFRSTVVIGAVAGIAAQGILQDIMAGLMLSIYKPFDIGDRILLPDVEKPCIVETLTMRHTVLKTMDGMIYVIPNSVINSKVITNASYRQRLRGTFIKIPISYEDDLRMAISAIRKAVKENPYTCPNNQYNADLDNYGEVYVMAFESSYYLLETVIWTEPETDNFLACSEVRMSIVKELNSCGIEIPYAYLNVLLSEKDEAAGTVDADKIAIKRAEKRNIRIKTDKVKVDHFDSALADVMKKVDQYARHYKLSTKRQYTMEMLSEELLNFTREIDSRMNGEFWIEGNRNKVQLHLKTTVDMTAEKRQEILSVSSSGENAAVEGFVDIVREMMAKYQGGTGRAESVNLREYDGLNGENLEKILLTKLSDDIRVGIRDNDIHIVVYKKFKKERTKDKVSGDAK